MVTELKSAGDIIPLDAYRKFDIGSPDRCWKCGISEDIRPSYGEGGYVWSCPKCPHPSGD